MTDNLKLIKSLSREEVFEEWRKVEENLDHWKYFWKAKGYKSWADWRKETHAPVLKINLNWKLYEVKNPLKTAPEWRGGMFNAWNKWFYGNFKEKPPRLKDLLTHPGVHNHWYIRKISNKFPKETIITAISIKNDIFIIEGMHRACALTLIAHNKEVFKSKIKIIIADWPKKSPPKLGHWNK